jgi:uncharacterized RDD family membrane protein YckC
MTATSSESPALSADNSEQSTQPQPAGVLRRLGAMVYDALICVAVLFVPTFVLTAITSKVFDPSEVGLFAYVYRAGELALLAAFFVFFWTRRGQTVGMQAWRLRIEDEHGQLLKWRSAFERFIYAAGPWLLAMLLLSFGDLHAWSATRIAGIAFAVCGVLNLISPWFDHERRSWHDKLSRSRVMVTAKEK